VKATYHQRHNKLQAQNYSNRNRNSSSSARTTILDHEAPVGVVQEMLVVIAIVSGPVKMPRLTPGSRAAVHG
jgi:hypothetical protein